MEMKTYTEDEVERIRRFLVRDLMAAQTAIKGDRSILPANKEIKVKTFDNAIDIVNDIFEVYTLDSTDY